MTHSGKWAWLVAGLALGSLFPFALPQPPPPRPPRPPLQKDVPERIKTITQKLTSMAPANTTAERAIAYSRTYLQAAEKEGARNQWFAADRLTGAADSLLHVAEHEEHLTRGGGPKGPPPAEKIKEHLQRVYFRVKQADFFLRQARDQRANALPKWAGDFYQVALRAYDRNDFVAADENAKCAEEVVAALEHLAQSQLPDDMPPPPPPPKGPAGVPSHP